MTDSSSSTRPLCEDPPPLCDSVFSRLAGAQIPASGTNGAASAADSGGSNGTPAAATAAGSAGRIKVEPFGGRSGSVSFCGLTYHTLEERELVSSPFKEGTGSFLWIAGPLALISSLLLPQFLISGPIEAALQDEILAGNRHLRASRFVSSRTRGGWPMIQASSSSSAAQESTQHFH